VHLLAKLGDRASHRQQIEILARDDIEPERT